MRALAVGRPVAGAAPDAEPVALVSAGRLVAIAAGDARGLRPSVVLEDPR